MTDAFTELCVALRRSNGRFTRLETFDRIPPGYGRRLGEALLHNTTVTYLGLNLDSVLPPDDATMEDAAPLLLYLRTTATLKEFTISLNEYTSHPHPMRGNLGESILQALASNASIKTVDIGGLAVSPLSIAHLLTTSTSIAKLTISDRDFNGNDIQSLSQVADAFEANRTIEEWTIRQVRRASSHGMEREQILVQLGANRALKTLSLCGFSCNNALSHFQAIAALISSTQTLESLDLSHYSFLREHLDLFLTALATNKSVTRLRLTDCMYDAEAMRGFVKFMQQYGSNETAHGSLKVFGIKKTRQRSNFYIQDIPNAACMLIGSSIECMQLDLCPPTLPRDRFQTDLLALFFDTCAENESKIRLADLHLEFLGDRGRCALLRFLPQSTRLHNLVVTCMDYDVDGWQVASGPVLTAMRKNGSLHSISLQKLCTVQFRDMHDSDVEVHHFRSEQYLCSRPSLEFFSTQELVRASAYCMRNKMIPLLFQRPLTNKFACTNTSTTATAAAADGDNAIETTDLTLVPSLMVAVREATRMAPNFVLMGLTAASGDVFVKVVAIQSGGAVYERLDR